LTISPAALVVVVCAGLAAVLTVGLGAPAGCAPADGAVLGLGAGTAVDGAVRRAAGVFFVGVVLRGVTICCLFGFWFLGWTLPGKDTNCQ
jgi:hypothetical protein